MDYEVAVRDGLSGHGTSVLRTEIYLGLMQGFSGPTQGKQEVVEFLAEWYRGTIARGKIFLPLIITDATLTFSHSSEDGSTVAEFEPALIIVCNKPPFSQVADDDWKDVAEDLAKTLGEQFKQTIVEFISYRVEMKIFSQV